MNSLAFAVRGLDVRGLAVTNVSSIVVVGGSICRILQGLEAPGSSICRIVRCLGGSGRLICTYFTCPGGSRGAQFLTNLSDRVGSLPQDLRPEAPEALRLAEARFSRVLEGLGGSSARILRVREGSGGFRF